MGVVLDGELQVVCLRTLQTQLYGFTVRVPKPVKIETRGDVDVWNFSPGLGSPIKYRGRYRVDGALSSRAHGATMLTIGAPSFFAIRQPRSKYSTLRFRSSVFLLASPSTTG